MTEKRHRSPDNWGLAGLESQLETLEAMHSGLATVAQEMRLGELRAAQGTGEYVVEPGQEQQRSRHCKKGGTVLSFASSEL